MILNEDYRGVNKEVWDLLVQIYGGGPAIVRRHLDIYSRPAIVPEEEKKKPLMLVDDKKKSISDPPN